jgi:hypothetical protein
MTSLPRRTEIDAMHARRPAYGSADYCTRPLRRGACAMAARGIADPITIRRISIIIKSRARARTIQTDLIPPRRSLAEPVVVGTAQPAAIAGHDDVSRAVASRRARPRLSSPTAKAT